MAILPTRNFMKAKISFSAAVEEFKISPVTKVPKGLKIFQMVGVKLFLA